MQAAGHRDLSATAAIRIVDFRIRPLIFEAKMKYRGLYSFKRTRIAVSSDSAMSPESAAVLVDLLFRGLHGQDI